MSMPRTYIAQEDKTVIGHDGRPIRYSTPTTLDHSESDLKLHRRAGIAAIVVAVAMVALIGGTLLW